MSLCRRTASVKRSASRRAFVLAAGAYLACMRRAALASGGRAPAMRVRRSPARGIAGIVTARPGTATSPAPSTGTSSSTPSPRCTRSWSRRRRRRWTPPREPGIRRRRCTVARTRARRDGCRSERSGPPPHGRTPSPRSRRCVTAPRRPHGWCGCRSGAVTLPVLGGACARALAGVVYSCRQGARPSRPAHPMCQAA